MKEQYQNEVSQIHVPTDLLMKTKQAMKEEEERLQKQKNRAKVIPIRIMSVAAAVLILIIAYPAVTSLLKSGKEQEMQGQQMLLSEQKTELIAIDKNETVDAQALRCEEVSEMPKEFENGEEFIVDGKNILLIQSEDGFWKAYYETDGQGFVISSKLLQKTEFVDELESIL